MSREKPDAGVPAPGGSPDLREWGVIPIEPAVRRGLPYSSILSAGPDDARWQPMLDDFIGF